MACADQATSHCLNQWWWDCWRIYPSLDLNELTSRNTQNDAQLPKGFKYWIGWYLKWVSFWMFVRGRWWYMPDCTLMNKTYWIWVWIWIWKCIILSFMFRVVWKSYHWIPGNISFVKVNIAIYYEIKRPDLLYLMILQNWGNQSIMIIKRCKQGYPDIYMICKNSPCR